MFFPLFNKVKSYINMCATAIVSMWVKCANVYRTECASMCQSLFGTEPVKNKINQNIKVNKLILYCIVIWQLKIICYTTKNVHCTTRINFLFFLKHDLDFHLSVLELIFITLRKPNLCRQKEFVYKHKAVPTSAVLHLVGTTNLKHKLFV